MSDKAELIFALIIGFCGISPLLYFAHACFYALFMNIREKIRGLSSKLVPCNVCGHEVSKTAIICPSCGESFGRGSTSSIAESMFAMLVLGVLSGALAVFLIIVMFEPAQELYLLFTSK
ncbi:MULTISPECIES: hypothetical protein [Paenibacillus]|uniref:hypothetical protein n=1 Tax=Paenibacillus TaxID=44249 RepID=UPI0012B82F8E|nr:MULTISPECIES: hypothetical protein [Paenibacillus]